MLEVVFCAITERFSRKDSDFSEIRKIIALSALLEFRTKYAMPNLLRTLKSQPTGKEFTAV
jgi:hypothetical protein